MGKLEVVDLDVHMKTKLVTYLPTQKSVLECLQPACTYERIDESTRQKMCLDPTKWTWSLPTLLLVGYN